MKYGPAGTKWSGRRRIKRKSGVAAAVGALAAAVGAHAAAFCDSDAGKCRTRAKMVLRSDRARIWFMGKKITVNQGKQNQARNALQIAWKTKQKWEDADWELEKNEVLREFRQGITHGGGRFKEGQMVQPLYF